MRTLIVSHTAAMGGAEHSLLRFLDALPAGYATAVACPTGPLAARLAERGIPRFPLRGTSGSLRLHPVHTPQAVAEIAEMAVQVRRHAWTHGADVVHANSIRAGLVAVGARALGGPPVAVHVRDVLPPGRMSEGTRTQLRRGARTIVAISQHVARAFVGGAGSAGAGTDAGAGARARVRASTGAGARGGARASAPPAGVHVVMELVDPTRFQPMPQERARAALGLPAHAPVLAVLAQITPWKGQDVAIRAFADIHRQRPDALLLVVGEVMFAGAATRMDNRAYERSLHELAASLGVSDAVRFLGRSDDVPTVLAAIDVLLVPSREEPFGLCVIEAMAMQRAVVATNVGGPAEVIEDGVDGLLADPLDTRAWSAAAGALLDDPDARDAMGAAGRRRVVESFSPARYGAAMARAYDATAGVAA